MPTQLMLSVSGTLASRYFDLATNYNIVTVGNIPRGFPGLFMYLHVALLDMETEMDFLSICFLPFLAFELPDLDLSKHLILDGFIIAVVSYTITVSIALTFAQKLNYEIDFNQELLALGASNMIGSCFSCLPLSASLSRSGVQVMSGGRTQLTSVVSCAILASVLLWIGPFFEVLPKVSCITTFISTFPVLCCIFSIFYIFANIPVLAVHSSQYYSGCIKRYAQPSARFLQVLENLTFGCDCLDGYILDSGHCFH